jgi:hypothetical protein
MIHANQRGADVVINLNKLKIDFEFPPAKFKNDSRSETGFEIKNIFNFNSDAGKLNEKLYLISRLYTAISIQKKNIYEDFFGSMADLILQI